MCWKSMQPYHYLLHIHTCSTKCDYKKSIGLPTKKWVGHLPISFAAALCQILLAANSKYLSSGSTSCYCNINLILPILAIYSPVNHGIYVWERDREREQRERISINNGIYSVSNHELYTCRSCCLNYGLCRSCLQHGLYHVCNVIYIDHAD